jgi:hypothetical protein
VKGIAGAVMKDENQKQRLYGLITTAIESLPARYNKDRVISIVEEMFKSYAGEKEFFAAISVIGWGLSAMQREMDGNPVDTLAVMQ